jgi:hypothetical protein
MAKTTFSGPVLSQSGSGFIGSITPGYTGLTVSTVATAATLTYVANTITVNNFTGAAAQLVTLPEANVGVVVVHAQSVDTTGGTNTLIFDCAGSDAFQTGSVVESRTASAVSFDTSIVGETRLVYTPANAVTNLFSIGSKIFFSCTTNGIWTINFDFKMNPASTGTTGTFAFAA